MTVRVITPKPKISRISKSLRSSFKLTRTVITEKTSMAIETTENPSMVSQTGINPQHKQLIKAKPLISGQTIS